MNIYLAHPIDLAGQSDLLTSVKVALMSEGHTFYDPHAAWNLGIPVSMGGARRLFQGNLAVLSTCDLVVALLDGPTVGVPIEMFVASENEIPVIVVGDSDLGRSIVLKALGATILSFDEFCDEIKAGAHE